MSDEPDRTDLSRRAGELHARSLVVVIHDHNPVAPDLPLMLAGGVTAKVHQLVVDIDIGLEFWQSAAVFEGWAKRALVSLETALADIESHRDICSLALTAADIEQAKREGKAAILLGVEGGKLLEGELALLRVFYRLGLRELQLTWVAPNQLAQDGRLTDFGREVVRECSRLGIIVDVTHLPEQAFYEVMAMADRPVIVSHGATGGADPELDDRRIRAIARTGGLIGIHFYTSYLGPNPGAEDVVRHVDYVARLVGIDYVGLGGDYFPTTGSWREYQQYWGVTDISWAIRDMSHMPAVTEALMRRGYTESDIQKVLGLNFLRVCREVFGG